MKKIITILIILLTITGCNKESNEMKTYKSYINELDKINESSENIPFDINIQVEQLEKNYLSYTILIDRKDLQMNNIEAIIIHDKETENIFPSIGIFDEKITLTDEKDKKGIKLTGYVEKYESITFKFMIKYKSEEDIEEKYYYIYNYRQ